MSPFMVSLYLYNNSCLMSCPAGYWKNSSGSTCDPCNAACALCSDSTVNTCTQCRNISSDIYYKQIGANVCSLACPDGQFIHPNIPNYCQPCSPNCITCANTAENCTNLSCSINYYYLNNSCLTLCPNNYYSDSSLRQCLQCAAGCQKCFGSGLDACTKCSTLGNGTQYYLQIGNTTCGPICNLGEYPSSLTKKCEVCPDACRTCTSQSVCQSCRSVNGLAYYL